MIPRLLPTLFFVSLASLPLHGDEAEAYQDLTEATLTYSFRVEQALEVINDAHLKALDELAAKYTRLGDSESARALQKERERIQLWQESLTRSIFPLPLWLPGTKYHFRAQSGPVSMEFHADTVSYKKQGEAAQEFRYRITGPRHILIHGGEDYTVIFEPNFTDGVLKSSRGSYPLDFKGQD